MYSPLFSCANRIFNEAGNKSAIKDMIIQACQFDRRTREYIGPISRIMYSIFPDYWYRRDKGLFE
jgi:glycerol-3-phosphate dehydrogenase (NAD(P)+)